MKYTSFTVIMAVLVTTTLVFGGLPSAHAQSAMSYRNFTVELVPNPKGGYVEIPTPPQGHGANSGQKKPGYVGYGENEAGWTTFVIRGQNLNGTCLNERVRGAAKWVITRLELTGVGNASTEKGTGFGGSVDEDWVWQSFMLVDRDNGVLFEADKDTAPTYLQIYNANAHDSELGEKLIYYRLEITPCDDSGASILVDPVWTNGGRG